MTEEQQDVYIAEYEAKEGTKLDKDKIVVNPGRKAVTKVMFNSFGENLVKQTINRKQEHCKMYQIGTN